MMVEASGPYLIVDHRDEVDCFLHDVQGFFIFLKERSGDSGVLADFHAESFGDWMSHYCG